MFYAHNGGFTTGTCRLLPRPPRAVLQVIGTQLVPYLLWMPRSHRPDRYKKFFILLALQCQQMMLKEAEEKRARCDCWLDQVARDLAIIHWCFYLRLL